MFSRKTSNPETLLSLPEAMAILSYDLNHNLKLQKYFKVKFPANSEILIDVPKGDLMPSPWSGEPWRYIIPVTIVDRSINRRWYYLCFVSPYKDGVGFIGARSLERPWTGWDMDKIIVYEQVGNNLLIKK